MAGVQVGDVTVRLDKGLIKGKEGGGGVEVSAISTRGYLKKGGQPSIQKLVRSYRSRTEELQWARNGFLATVINGESIPVIQKRIADAGVNGIEIIPVGADIVFLQCLSEVNIATLLHDTKEFFDHFSPI